MTIYRIVNLIDNKCYIGQTIQKNVSRRWSVHIGRLRKNLHSNTKLQNAWNKHGSSNFVFGVVASAKTVDHLNELESFLIQQFDSISNGYNIRSGGNNSSLSQEIKAKMSIARTGMKHSVESKQKRSDSIKEYLVSNDHNWLGRYHTENTKRKMSVAARGKKKSDEARMNMSKAALLREAKKRGEIII